MDMPFNLPGSIKNLTIGEKPDNHITSRFGNPEK
jgi:hypothetical protein